MNTEIPSQPGASGDSAPTSLASRLMNVFSAPGEVFAEVKSSPNCFQNWLVPALVFLLASWVGAAIMFSQDSVRHQMEEVQEAAMQKQFQKQIEAGKMTQAQVNQVKASAAQFGSIGQIIAAVIVPFFVAGLTPFWGGLIIWLGGFVFGRRLDYMKAVEAAGLPLMILAVGALVKGLLAAAMGNAFVSIGPALLVKNFDPTNMVHTSLIAIDVFAIWALALRAIGLAKLGDISMVKALVWVFGIWITFTGAWFCVGLLLQKAGAAMSGQN
jgi:hypothetical protein